MVQIHEKYLPLLTQGIEIVKSLTLKDLIDVLKVNPLFCEDKKQSVRFVETRPALGQITFKIWRPINQTKA